MNTADFVTQVAVRAGVPLPAVDRVFQECGIVPALGGTLPRPVALRRLRVVGSRSVEPFGSFDREFIFGPGLTVLAADNLRGKTSLLELITWCLRGSPRSNLQGVVKGWLSRLECDVMVAGRALGFRLGIEDGQLVDGRVLSAADAGGLAGRGAVEIIRASDPAAYASMVEPLMMELLGLEMLASRSSRSASGKASHGWPAYFGALYLPPGGDPALLGDVVIAGLAGRLLQVFLDLPGAALLTRMKATRDQIADADRAADADAARMHALLTAQRHEAAAELEAARQELASLAGSSTIAVRVASVSDRAAGAVAAEASLREARETFGLLRWQRQTDERRLNDLREDQAARSLFHALDPQVCPRCERPIRPERRAAERLHDICAVCTEPHEHGPEDHDRAKAAEVEAGWRLAASRAAEEMARKHLDDAVLYATDRRQALSAAERELDLARSADAEERRHDLVRRVARLEGAVGAWESLTTGTGRRADDVRAVLDAAIAVLTDEQTTASEALFLELNADIAELARAFGFRNLDRVVADRAGRLQVYKTGGPREWFGTQSPGERLRLRIAVVVALLRRGHRHGVATHPGLLLIDSPRSEEVQDDNAAALLAALEQLCHDTPDLQLLVTTADENLVRRTLKRSTIITPPGPGEPLW